MKFVCVCAHCNKHTDENGVVEFNFRDMAVYFFCPACNKMNKLLLKPPDRPYARTKVSR